MGGKLGGGREEKNRMFKVWRDEDWRKRKKGQVENRGRTSGRLRQEGRGKWKTEQEQVEG